MLGIRGSVWVVAALVIAAAWSPRILSGRSGREVAASEDSAWDRTQDERHSPAARRAPLRGSTRQGELRPVPNPAATGTAVAIRQAAAPSPERTWQASPRARVDEDPELIRDLRILEEEAARLANGAPWLAGTAMGGSAGAAAPPAAPAPAGVEDPQRRRLSDAALEEFLVRQSYAGIVFPAGYPAERVARMHARRQIEALSPAARRGLLSDAVETLRGPEEGPEFHAPETGRVWAGGPG